MEPEAGAAGEKLGEAHTRKRHEDAWRDGEQGGAEGALEFCVIV